jgi:hypothetical protein
MIKPRGNTMQDYITQKAQNAIKFGHLKQDTKNMFTFGLIVSLLTATHLLAYNSGVQTGVIIHAHTIDVADAVAEKSSSTTQPGYYYRYK